MQSVAWASVLQPLARLGFLARSKDPSPYLTTRIDPCELSSGFNYLLAILQRSLKQQSSARDSSRDPSWTPRLGPRRPVVISLTPSQRRRAAESCPWQMKTISLSLLGLPAVCIQIHPVRVDVVRRRARKQLFDASSDRHARQHRRRRYTGARPEGSRQFGPRALPLLVDFLSGPSPLSSHSFMLTE